MCHADAMSRLPLNDTERDEVPLPDEVVFLLQTLDCTSMGMARKALENTLENTC